MKKIFTSLFAICIASGSLLNAQNVLVDITTNNKDAIKEATVSNAKATPLHNNNIKCCLGILSTQYAQGTPGSVTVADDFTVPTAEQWELDSAKVSIYWHGVAPVGYVLDFYENDASGSFPVPGALKYSFPFTANLPAALTLYNLKLTLNPATHIFTPGTYFMSVRGVYNSAVDFNNGVRWNRQDTLVSANSCKVQDSIAAYFTGNPPWQGIAFAAPENPTNSVKFSIFGSIENVTGVKTQLALENDAVVAYPNPAKDQITFATSNTAVTNVSIYDVTGSLVETISMNKLSVAHNIAKYESGVYFYKSIGNDNELIGAGKFIVK